MFMSSDFNVFNSLQFEFVFILVNAVNELGNKTFQLDSYWRYNEGLHKMVTALVLFAIGPELV
jgi:hypothetical protein